MSSHTIVLAFDPVLYPGFATVTAWPSHFIRLLNNISVGERWDILGVAERVCYGECSEFVSEILKMFADLAVKDILAEYDLVFDSEYCWDTFEVAYTACYVIPEYPFSSKFEVCYELQMERILPEVVVSDVEVFSVPQMDRARVIDDMPEIPIYTFEQEALVNSLNDKWEYKLLKRYERNVRKREKKKLRRVPTTIEEVPLELEFELPAAALVPIAPPSTPTVPTLGDWRRKLQARKLQRRLKWEALLPSIVTKRIFDRLFRKCCAGDVEFQAGSAREQRDEQQRKAAARAATKAYKAKPKRERAQEVKKARDKRIPVFQSGDFKVAALSAGVALLGSQLWQTLRKTGKAADDIGGIATALKSFCDDLRRKLGAVLWVIPAVMLVKFALKWFSCEREPLGILLTSTLLGLVGKTLWSHISDFFHSGNAATEFQSGPDLSVFAKLLTTLFTFSVFKGKRSPFTITELCKRIAMADRLAAGWETFMTWTLQSIDVLVNFVRKALGKERITLYKSVNTPIYEWAKRVSDYCMAGDQNKPLTREDVDLRLKDLELGYGYLTCFRGTKMEQYINDYISKLNLCLLPYKGSLDSRSNFRFEPSCVMLYGPPGIGKTLMSMHFCAAVMLGAGLLPPNSNADDVAKNVWQKGATEYWEGYAGQICYMMDDAFQVRASPGVVDNDYITLIRAIGSWAFPLNYAALHLKGTNGFRSKLVVGNTNVASIASEAGVLIAEPEAVARRLTFPYHLRLRAGFKDSFGRLDYAKFEQESKNSTKNTNPVDRFPWHIWEARRHDFMSGMPSGEWRSFSTVIDEVIADVKKRSTNFQNAREHLEDFVTGFNPVEVEEQAGDAPPSFSNTIRRCAEHVSEFERTGSDSAFRRAASEIHPDKNSDHKEMATRLTQELNHFRDTYKVFVQESQTASKSVETALRYVTAGFLAFAITKLILGLASGVWSILCGFFGGRKKIKESKFTMQSNRPLTATQIKKAGNGRLPVCDPVFQSCDQQVASNAYANSYKLFAYNTDGSVSVFGQVTFVVSDMAMQPAHFTRRLQEKIRDGEIRREDRLYFRNAVNAKHAFYLSVGQYMELPRTTVANDDIEFVRFLDVRAHRNITKSFITEADLNYISNKAARLDICEVDNGVDVIDGVNRTAYVVEHIQYGQDMPVTGVVVRRYFQYRAATKKGDCGGLLSLFDNRNYSGRTVIGFHFAGDSSCSYGFSTIVTREIVNAAVVKLSAIKDNFIEDLSARGVELQIGEEQPFDDMGSFLPIGIVNRPVNINPKSSYFVTPLYGVFGPYGCSPAPMGVTMRDGVRVYPMVNAVKPYSTPLLVFDQPWLKSAVHVALHRFQQETIAANRNIISFEQAILGIPERKFRSIPRSTSAGYPYTLDVHGGKKVFFGEGESYDLSGPECAALHDRVMQVVDDAKSGTRSSHIFMDFLKDELRSNEKVEKVATRMISSAPLDYVVAFRMYFGAFSMEFMENNVTTGSCPGISCYSDWPRLSRHLQSKGKKVFDGDFKSFDSSEQPTIARLILDAINAWYGDSEENQMVRRVLWEDLIHSRHIGGDGYNQKFIYQWNKSLPSGHPFTTIFNTIYALTVLVGSYHSLTGDVSSFWDHVSPAVYGDDNVCNITDSISGRFNQETVSQAMFEEFGLTYTSGSKDGNLIQYTTIDKVTFLKRRFNVDDGQWLCPLEFDSFLYTFYWSKNKRLMDKIISDEFETALEELSLHSSEVWAQYSGDLETLMYKRGQVSRLPIDQKQYRLRVLAKKEAWY